MAFAISSGMTPQAGIYCAVVTDDRPHSRAVLFGATGKLGSLLAHLDELKSIVILCLRKMTAIDATGLKAIQDFADAMHASRRELLLCGAPPQPTA